MREPRLQNRLEGLAQLQRRAGLLVALAKCWAVGAVVGLALLIAQRMTGWDYHRKDWIAPLAAGVALAVGVCLRRNRGRDDIVGLVQILEPGQPELRHLLSAAVEQRAGEGSGGFGFLQMRVIEEVLAHPRQAVWRRQLQRRLALAQASHAGALLVLAAVAVALGRGGPQGVPLIGALVGEQITVTPGDTEVERGTGLVITARFGGLPPLEATLVLDSGTGKESRIPMARRLADPVFGASVPEVVEAGVYRIEYRGKRTRPYRVAVFEFPALLRADAELRYPAYTGLTNRTIRDTLRVSAVQGTHLSYTLQLNKPVVRARWVGKEQSLPLTAQSNAVALLPDLLLTNSTRYALELTDAEGRRNKFPSDFILQALTNQRPEIKLVFPRGDRRVSCLEELQLQAEATDDFGLLKYGVGYGVAGQDPRIVELGQSVPARIKRPFEYLIPLEGLGVEVDQAVAYFAWADDYGPDGVPRRTFSDMFFAEVRPFEEVFRQDQSGAAESGGQSGNQGGSQGGGGNERARLAELQKQIVIATWNLQREKGGAGGAQHP